MTEKLTTYPTEVGLPSYNIPGQKFDFEVVKQRKFKCFKEKQTDAFGYPF
jgi:hypothetical protein